MGQRIDLADPGDALLARAEWTQAERAASPGPTAPAPAVETPAEPPREARPEAAGDVAASDPVGAAPEADVAETAGTETASEPDIAAEEDLPAERGSLPHPEILTSPTPLPPIVQAFRDRRFAEVQGDDGETIAGFLADRLQGHLGHPGPEAIYLKSLGGSLPDAEARLVTALQARGLSGIRMQVLDADPEMADARRQRVERAGLGRRDRRRGR